MRGLHFPLEILLVAGLLRDTRVKFTNRKIIMGNNGARQVPHTLRG